MPAHIYVLYCKPLIGYGFISYQRPSRHFWMGNLLIQRLWGNVSFFGCALILEGKKQEDLSQQNDIKNESFHSV